jgi:S1-C subfamily serine protease
MAIDVVVGSAAAKAGLQRGDAIVAVSAAQLRTDVEPGETIELDL